jgi:hypothetical protein
VSGDVDEEDEAMAGAARPTLAKAKARVDAPANRSPVRPLRVRFSDLFAARTDPPVTTDEWSFTVGGIAPAAIIDIDEHRPRIPETHRARPVGASRPASLNVLT